MYRTTTFVSVLVLVLAMPLQAVFAAPEPLSLKEAISRMDLGGREGRIADKALESAKDQADMARAPLLTQVTASAGQTYYAYQPASIASGQKIFTSQRSFSSYGVDFFFFFFDFGSLHARHKAADVMAQSLSDEAVLARNRGVLNIITTYFDALEAGRMIMLARRELTSFARHAKDVTVLYREGVATKNELLSTKVGFNNARQKLVTARSHEKIALARIRELLFMPADAELSLEDVEVHVPGQIKLVEGMADAVKRRSELRALDKAIRSAEFNEEAARSANKPEVFVNGGYNSTDNRYQVRNDNWRGTVGVKLSVFNGGLIKAQAAKAGHDKEQLIEQRYKLVEDMRFEVEKNHWDMNNARERMILSRTGTAQADENARVAEARYLEGAGTSSDVLDALAMRSSAETELWRSTYELKRAYARLLYAMGKDLSREYLEVAYENK